MASYFLIYALLIIDLYMLTANSMSDYEKT